MTDDTTPKKSSARTGLILAGFAVLIAGAYAVYSINGNNSNIQDSKNAAETATEEIAAAPEGLTKALATGALSAFLIHKERRDIAELNFKDGEGNDLTLDNWKGKVVLVNLWATWCAPCRKEMPHFADLQKRFGGADFEVVAISVDRKGVEASGRFLVETKATDLNLYIDKTTKVLGKVRAVGLPTTILIDREGKEVGRLLGPAVWNGPDAVRLIKTAIAEK